MSVYLIRWHKCVCAAGFHMAVPAFELSYIDALCVSVTKVFPLCYHKCQLDLENVWRELTHFAILDLTTWDHFMSGTATTMRHS